MHEFLLQTFQQVTTLDDDEIQLFKSLFKERTLKKGEFFLASGEVNKQMGFIHQGLLRYFVYKNEEEATLEFSKEGEFVAEYQSFVQQSPSIQSIQAIEDSVLLTINRNDLHEIYEHTKNGNKIGRIVIEHRFNILVRQLLSIYMHNPDERYKNFIKVYPDLVQRVPQYYIASYVGVKPQSLSRIRKRIIKNIS